MRPFLCYYKAKVKQHRIDTAYKHYMADMAMYSVNNTAEYFGGTKIVKSFKDIVNPPREEERTAEEIIQNIRDKMNGIKT